MSDSTKATRRNDKSDLVATWTVPLLDGVHVIEFEHGTTSGKRVIRVDGKEILRREWMFKLVGEEVFTLGAQKAKCVLRVDPLPLFAFSYGLLVDGKPLEKFTEKQEATNRYWSVITEAGTHKVVLERHSLDVFVDAKLIETENTFVEEGTEMKFEINGVFAVIKASYTHKREGVIHELYVNGQKVEEDSDIG
ncbi:fas apoptotic inhibitory molecule 1 [Coccinella septempunctata]|uniref:fas apoptotic inhibitory molecule 1 n=1 Tax=Coccinella septempunctata TaxID=41139 RepID=UPI001D06CE26|nr:fas apoptotic inhibitory molecule 1 [Coccinella septempunctata]